MSTVTLNLTPAHVHARICDAATAEADAAFEALFDSDPHDKAASLAAWDRLNDSYETLRLALLTAGHPVETMTGAAVHGYAELNGPFA